MNRMNRSDRTGRTDRPNGAGRMDRPQRAARPGGDNRGGRAGRPSGAGRGEQRFDRPQREQRAARPERAHDANLVRVPPLMSGTVQKLRVKEETSHGFTLTNGTQDVLLPFPEALGQPLKAGVDVDAYLYHDSEDRMTATLREPLAKVGDVARLKVADIHPTLGCFLDIGLVRHVLLPAKELPKEPSVFPKEGDEVYVLLDRDKEGRLLARAVKEADLERYAFKAPEAWRNRWMDAWVYRSLQTGALVVVEGGVLGFGAIGFIPSHERTRPLRVGEKVNARVTFVREDGHVNLSMRQRKEVGRNEDADKLLAELRRRPDGTMPYSDESPSEAISKRFGISKSAFKRAIGKLYKDGLIEQKGSWTHLTEKGKQAAEGEPLQ
ncbi:CvfB family protein [Paenibacillus sp.]|uniref:CvfB family protein n=1 Tax=Paenibacillus sp. TaxID=58172 RepID=UPI002D374960|nr:S1-like domain-containing RNA-binding protein [Paenibacillus sp.]HZG84123.1 S1-like domain-containing RNA-binding protein [Paenibacillus sp.]